MKLTKVEDINTPLIVGKDYLVPCVYMPCDVEGFKAHLPIPIIGVLHADPELGPDIPHFHYDNRFIEKPIPDGRVIAIIRKESRYDEAQASYNVEETHVYAKRVLYLKQRCYRNEVGFPSRLAVKIQEKYLSCHLENGYCPHRNAFLGNYPPKNGTIICPATALSRHRSRRELGSEASVIEVGR